MNLNNLKAETYNGMFWQSFKKFTIQNSYDFLFKNTENRNYLETESINNCHFGLQVKRKENEIRCVFYIKNNKLLFDTLHEDKYEIEAKTGKLIWDEKVNKDASSIFQFETLSADLNNKNSWEYAFKWYCFRLSIFQAVLSKYL